VLTLAGSNKRGQSLDEVKELLLGQLDLLKKGDFPDWLMEAAINNLRLQQMRMLENSRSRAMTMAMSFLNGVPYERTFETIDLLGSITKQDVVEFANEHLRHDNYVAVYKRQGQPAHVEVVDKPAITPIHINRDVESPLLTQVKNASVDPIEPVFLDYEKDVSASRTRNGIEVLYAKNEANPTFTLTYHWEMGSQHDRYLPFAARFANFLETPGMSAEDISNEFFKLACSYSVFAGNEETRITLSGLAENLVPAMHLVEEVLLNGRAGEAALRQYIENTKKSRQDSKANQQANLSALVDYATYGNQNPSRHTLTDQELDALTVEDLVGALQHLWGVEHRVVFFGPQPLPEVVGIIQTHHRAPASLQPVPEGVRFAARDTREDKVYFAHYDANQSYLQTVAKGMDYDPARIPQIQMYNSYFGGGMNAIVFQEMREKRGLAYRAGASYRAPSRPDESYLQTSLIATQNDKVVDAFSAFNELFNDMPLSETSFRLAQEQMISNIRTQRIRDANVIWSYLSARRMGLDTDIRRQLYEALPGMTLEDVAAFNRRYVKDQPKTYIILGHRDSIDFGEVERLFGPVTRLGQEDLFIF